MLTERDSQQKWSENWIKKAQFGYLDCKQGGLHEGEKMSFVCIDQKCPKRGLICPVCQEMDHKEHKVMHLKVFLGKLTGKFMTEQSQNSDEKFQKGLALNEQLQGIQACRKEMLTNLQDTIKQMANQVKKIQKKINDNFCQVRRIILSQSTANKKLPEIFNILVSQKEGGKFTDQDQRKIKQEVVKYIDISDVKNKEIVIGADGARVVEQYKDHGDVFVTHLMSLMSDFPTRLSALPLKLNKLCLLEGNDIKQDFGDFTFSDSALAQGITVSENKKQISMGLESLGGIVCINQGSNDSPIRKISLRIKESVSDSICIGLCDKSVLENHNYYLDQMTETDGVYGLCAMGINLYNIQEPSMMFSTGDTLELQFDQSSSRLTITRKNSIQKEQLILPTDQQTNKKLVFYASLVTMGDCVEIVS